MIGIHIRMGQPAELYTYEDISAYTIEAKDAATKWRNKSHWSNFTDEINKSLLENKHQMFLLCCDTNEARDNLLKLYPNNIVCRSINVYGRDVESVQNALIDALLLSQTEKQLGSNWSSFSELVRRFGNNLMSLVGVHF